MKKFVKCAVLSVLMVCVFVFSLPLTAFSAESYQFNINEPSVGDNQGYILVLTENVSSGVRQVQCISWTLLPIYTNNEVTYNATEMIIQIASDNSITFMGRSNGNFQLSAGFGRSLSGDNNRNLYWSHYENSVGLTYTYTSIGSAYKIIGFQLYGNAVIDSHPLGANSNTPFTVTWGDDSQVTSLMTEMLAQLYIAADNDQTIITQLDNLFGKMQDIETLIEKFRNDVSFDFDTVVSRLNEIRLTLYRIEEILKGSGESTFEEPSTESISDYNKAEGELVSGADDTSDIEEEIGNFEIDANSSAKIWDIITQFFNSHPKIMGLVIGMLCLGIIALILNR